ncbi:hypothetical protein CathTA2_0924 [Caldalkalibacillus thermarum TA2.A1]|uniref:Uncharacterized protein n=1 Tax=Caldalkalibacillus thermarum (strain TA2.A1) TaxID=986075 RepID=F5L561_CALTT|nr:hypothetical protein [Caldalkalibacillus thermarum]EGL83528.1 hypothetical protein CathTA2_0924 [Caldalkalibacillus thermarum TA2.A1]QZT32532.1 hypothetical protein HUR95_08915 [Caldalkalibacillus thermarum TA2.A1]
MDREMLLFQTRQDFIDLHQALHRGETVTVERYDRITRELMKMDQDNFELMLKFSEQTEGIKMHQMWETISAYIDQLKKKGDWRKHKETQLSWRDGVLFVNGKAARPF